MKFGESFERGEYWFEGFRDLCVLGSVHGSKGFWFLAYIGSKGHWFEGTDLNCRV